MDIDTKEALTIVREAKEKFGGFYIGGSRRMHEKFDGVATFSLDSEHTLPPLISNATISIDADTDYDLYATFSQDLYNFLTDRGFEDSGHDEAYLDDSAVAVVCCGYVQIVLRKDAEAYHAMFEDLTSEEYKTHVWKSSPMFTGTRDEIREYINGKLSMLITGGRQYGQPS